MSTKQKAARGSKAYWNRRVLVDKARIINNAEDFLLKNQQKLYGKAEKEILEEVEQLYQKFADQQKISLAEAKRLIRDADFRKIDWDGMVKQSMEQREQIRNGKGNLPDEVIRNLEERHKKLEDQLKAFAKRGRISYLELKQVEIDRKLLSLYDDQQKNIYDYLRSEYDDSYYRQVFNSQQMQGFGYDFIRPNEAAIDRAILNQYQRQNFSKTLYSHCDHFSKDLRENLVTGMIRGESLDKMASRIKKRMGVAYSAAKTLVRTETAYVYEQATKEAYEQCDIEWYEYLATLDNKTSEMCRELDGKHFRVKDAMPGRNYPPMHPNCRSTTVCWFPDEEGKKKQTTRLAKDRDGKYYEVPADMTYKQWQEIYRTEQGTTRKNERQKRPDLDPVASANRSATDAIRNIYEYRKNDLGINYMPFDEKYNHASFNGMDEQLAASAAQQFSDLVKEYNTTCTSINVERMEAFGVPASTLPNWNVQNSTITFNKAIVKDGDSFRERMRKAVEKGQFPDMAEEDYDKYVITHEFAHTLMDFDSSLKNYVGADTTNIKKARKEIRDIREKYMEEINELSKLKREAELKVLISSDEKAWETAKDLSEKISRIKISKYADSNVDEFMAEAFTDAKIGRSPSSYSKEVEKVLDRYFKRTRAEDKPFIMGNKTAAIVLNDVQMADSHMELAQYMSEKLRITYSDSMHSLDLGAVKQTVQGMEIIFDKFKGSKNIVKTVTAAPIGNSYMSCAVDTIKYNPDSFKKADRRLNYEMVGCHEAAHLLEWKLIDIMGYKDKEAAWNHGTAANTIVKEAARNLKAEYPNTSVKELKRQISKNAELSPSECLADSMVDFLYNAEKAAPLSKEIYKIVRRMIR